MMVWFDTHSHLQDEDFDQDRQEVLDRASREGVTRILLAASSLDDAGRACELALDQPAFYAAVGIHPHEARSWNERSASRLRDLVSRTNREGPALGRDRPVVAIGEIGLDFHYDFSPREVQHRVLRAQLELAFELGLPVIIHMREATAPMLEVLRQAARDGLFLEDRPAGVIHCYSGSAETVPALTELGFMIGFDGPLTFKNARKPQAALAAVPLDRLVLETDAPWLAPVPLRGKRNEPSYLPLIGRKAAEVLGLSTEDLARQTTANAERLFGLA